MSFDVAIVTDMDKVVDFYTIFDDRIFYRSTINRGARADLNIVPYHQPADMPNFH